MLFTDLYLCHFRARTLGIMAVEVIAPSTRSHRWPPKRDGFVSLLRLEPIRTHLGVACALTSRALARGVGTVPSLEKEKL